MPDCHNIYYIESTKQVLVSLATRNAARREPAAANSKTFTFAAFPNITHSQQLYWELAQIVNLRKATKPYNKLNTNESKS